MINTGWSNYITIPDWKLMFEISRYCNQDNLEYIKKDLELLENLHEELQRYSNDEISFKKTSMHEMSLRYVHSKKCEEFFNVCDYHLNEFMFMLLLEKYKVEYMVLSESEIDDRKNEFKDFRRINRNYE